MNKVCSWFSCNSSSKVIVSNLAKKLWKKNKHKFIEGRLTWIWYGYENGQISQSILPSNCIDRLLEIQDYINNIILKDSDYIELSSHYDTFTEKVHINFQVKPR